MDKKEMREEFELSQEQLAELAHVKSMPITFDEDCPEITPEIAVRFKRVNPPRNPHDAVL